LLGVIHVIAYQLYARTVIVANMQAQLPMGGWPSRLVGRLRARRSRPAEAAQRRRSDVAKRRWLWSAARQQASGAERKAVRDAANKPSRRCGAG
jgi:hypothetical protein